MKLGKDGENDSLLKVTPWKVHPHAHEAKIPVAASFYGPHYEPITEQ